MERWMQNLAGGGEASRIRSGSRRFLTILVTRDENDVALLRYVSDGNGGWLRDGYAARTSALRPS
jgi:hypothetical protein